MLQKSKLSIGTEDIAGVLGFGLLTFGIYQISRPAAFIVAGVILMTVSAILIFRKK